MKRESAPEAEDMDVRIIFPATKTLAAEIDDYRFEQRIGSKAEAIRRLIEAGLKAEHKRSRK